MLLVLFSTFWCIFLSFCIDLIFFVSIFVFVACFLRINTFYVVSQCVVVYCLCFVILHCCYVMFWRCLFYFVIADWICVVFPFGCFVVVSGCFLLRALNFLVFVSTHHFVSVHIFVCIFLCFLLLTVLDCKRRKIQVFFFSKCSLMSHHVWQLHVLTQWPYTASCKVWPPGPSPAQPTQPRRGGDQIWSPPRVS